ncbi:COX4I1, partial [Cordylochernes scorpioides]
MISKALILRQLPKISNFPIAGIQQAKLTTSAIRCHFPGVRLDDRIGNREVVGFGLNGSPSYIDHIDFPYPAIRFKEDDAELKKLREKEKGDWHLLTMEEKKKLYRASFRQTYAEFLAGYGEWKCIAAGVISLLGLSIFIYDAVLYESSDIQAPDSMKKENQSAQLQRMLDLRVGYMYGPASKQLPKISNFPIARIQQAKLTTSAIKCCYPGVRLDDRIGNREVVGYGLNGTPSYIDHIDFPYPAIRFKEDDAELKKLREKEKGDWHLLTIEEKKKLYRASYRQTYAEFLAGYGEWKCIAAGVISLIGLSIFLYDAVLYESSDIQAPDSMKKENQSAQLQRMIDLRVGFLRGPASKQLPKISNFPIARIQQANLTTSAIKCCYPGVRLDDRIGNREVVGYGLNGTPSYIDHIDFPYPAIRFKEDDAELKKLREKEKGDWHLLTIEEKKKLYRASYRQTYAEFLAGYGEWKCIAAGVISLVGLSIFLYDAVLYESSDIQAPDSMKKENQSAQLQRMIDLRVGFLRGPASKHLPKISNFPIARIQQAKLTTSAIKCCYPGVRLDDRVGNREVVGFGLNGTPSYIDHIDFPYPAIRFKEDDAELKKLREKEKGDWHKLTMEEKKKLYRASFRQTYAEFLAGYGEWKCIAAGVISLLGLSIFIYDAVLYESSDIQAPDSMKKENQSAQLQRMLDLRVGYMYGPAS